MILATRMSEKIVVFYEWFIVEFLAHIFKTVRTASVFVNFKTDQLIIGHSVVEIYSFTFLD